MFMGFIPTYAINAADDVDAAKERLSVLIKDASALKDKYPISTAEETDKGEHFVTAEDVAALQKAINEAIGVRDADPAATLDQLNEAVAKLKTATDTFNDKYNSNIGTKPVDKTELKAAIKLAEAKLAEVTESEVTDPKEIEKGKKVASKANIETFRTAIAIAKTFLDDGKTKEEVKKATDDIKAATTTFDGQIVTGTKEPQPTTHKVTINKNIYATVKTNQTDNDKVKVGDEVQVTVTTNEGYKFVSSTYEYTVDGKKTSETVSTEKYSFKMPNADVTISVKVEKETIPTPDPGYSSRVPRAVRITIQNAEDLQACPGFDALSKTMINSYENALNRLKDIADEFEKGYYYNRYYYNDGYYYRDYYYDDGYYYVNGIPYTYNEFYREFNYYPNKYYGYNDRYYGYNDEYYEYFKNGLYYKYGTGYTYKEYRLQFGVYPKYDLSDYDYRYWNSDNRYWDPYYGYDYYGYWKGHSLSYYVEDMVDEIRAAAEALYPTYGCAAKYIKLSYPSYSDYDGYYDFYGYRYDYDLRDSRIKELKQLIGEAEELAYSRKDSAWAPYKTELINAANNGRKAMQGRVSVADAIKDLEDAIKKAKEEGAKVYIRRSYMQGNTSNMFNPEGSMTRAEMAQILSNLLDQSGKTATYKHNNFKDVEEGRWYKKAIDHVASYNLMVGDPDGNFRPNDTVTKEQLIVIAARLGKFSPRKGNVFGIEKHYWSVPYIQTAYEYRWIGMERFNPADPISRGQATQILNRSMGYGVDEDFINKYGSIMNKFTDVYKSSQYYYDILAATNTISYTQADNSNTRIWRSVLTTNGWSNKNYTNGSYVKPYKGM